MFRRNVPLTPYLGAHAAAGAAAGIVVATGVAVHSGIGRPAPIDLLLAIGVGVLLGIALAPIGASVGARRRITRALPALLFPSLVVCYLLGRYANHGLTITAALVAYILALVGVGFFLRREPAQRNSAGSCPRCGVAVKVDDERCPNCAVQLTDVSVGNSSSLPTSSSTRSA